MQQQSMSQEIMLRCFSWYGDQPIRFGFPSDWEVRVMGFADLPSLDGPEIRERLRTPIGVSPLSAMARGRRDAVIIVDYLSRPTPAHRLLPMMLEELNEGGVDDDDILIVVGSGGHVPILRGDVVKKIGEEIARRVEVICHRVDDEMAYLGSSSFGTPILVNRHVMDADFKIVIGGIYPHGTPGFGGGGKMIVPGVVALETIRHYHSLKAGGLAGDLENPARQDIDEIASKVGVDFIANVVLNGHREIVELFAGHLVDAHREGVRFMRKVGGIATWKEADVVVANAYPMDTAYIYAGKGTWPLWERDLKEDAVRILIAACPEGSGYHRLYKVHRMVRKPRPDLWSARPILYSPVVQPKEAYKVYPDGLFSSSWEDLMGKLVAKYSDRDVKAAVYACPALQFPGGS